MNTTARTSTSERLGHAFGRGLRAYARGERRASNWLVSKGVPQDGVGVLLWVVKLAALGVLLYSAVWLALLLMFAVAAGWAASQGQPEEEFVLKFPATLDELREMPGYDPNLYEDTAHEMYSDDD